mmetsp:Transcript_44426/g.71156  ORF Transcript_44426/g.71156 Transcript_44426/m.71156 type:complete len:201 (-) Transcript_44426:324-926(-)|eukprot:CAMPEP_0197056742 /NCGR_PEP_ID=MMETSP1384-20130603/88848_1 /TAXON_ID=29189 /ORGANISM="Ammonia sp." /LENGTH=200 /DNA_ID=CAMNT_0042490869 /DNA_START=96 /DNA_END=698 /DNA_ORIENTATION=+
MAQQAEQKEQGTVKFKISLVGNEDGRKTAVGQYLTMHGSSDQDKRDQTSFYAIVDNDLKKVGVWALRPFAAGNACNLYRIQLVQNLDGRKTGKNHWLAVHGTAETDKRDGMSTYAITTADGSKASIWQTIPCGDDKDGDLFYLQVYGNVDGRKVAVGQRLTVHSTNKRDPRGQGFFVHVRPSNDKKSSQWRIRLHVEDLK